jgi:hypothetical protein
MPDASSNVRSQRGASLLFQPLSGVAVLKTWYGATGRIALSYQRKVGGGNVA